MPVLAPCQGIWGSATLIAADPAVVVRQNALYVPQQPTLYHSLDPAWGLYEADGTLCDAASYRRLPERALVGQSPRTALDPASFPYAPPGEYVYGGPMVVHYGHFITALLPRLWQVVRGGLPPGARILCHSNWPIADWFRQDYVRFALEALGLGPADFVVFDSPTRLREITVPCPALEEQHFAHVVFRELCLRIGRGLGRRPGTGLVYLSKSRMPFSLHNMLNKTEMEAVLASRGVEIVYPERLSLPQKIELLNGCEAVLGTASSGFHTSLFCNRPIQVVGLEYRRAVNANHTLVDALCGNRAEYLYAVDQRVVQESALAAHATMLADPVGAADELLHRVGDRSAMQAAVLARQALSHVVPLPAGRVVHAIPSPGFAYAPPDIVHPELIDPSIRPAMDSMWSTPQPARTVEFHALRDVYVVGEGLVFDSALNLLQPSITQTPASVVEAAFARLTDAVRTGSIATIRRPALLCGKAGLNNYGHWLAEMLPLAFLSLRWLGMENGWRVLVPKVYPWMREVIGTSLDLLGVTDERRVLLDGEPCHVEELVLVTGLTQHGQYFSPMVIDAMDALAAGIPAGSDPLVWITRAREKRCLLDEAGCNARLAEAGWRVVDPGLLPFRDQIAFAKGARHMAGVNGAGLANLLFMRPGSRLTSFVPAVMPDVFYWQLAGHRGLAYDEVRSTQHHEPTAPKGWDVPLTIGVDEVLAHLGRVSAA